MKKREKALKVEFEDVIKKMSQTSGRVLVKLMLIFYLVLIIIVGFYSSKLTKNIDDYALGGQRLGPTIIAFSERASGESAWLILGLPGAALVFGLFELWTVLGCLGGIFLSWIIIAFPIRQATEEYNIKTLPEYFERKLDISK